MRLIILVSTALVIVSAAGCSRSAPQGTTASETNQVDTRSTVDQTIGTMLQYDTLKAGRNAQDRTKRLVTEHNKRVGEALPDDL
ncbi:MAG: hypothetical protein WCP86_08600 [bacterium]